MTMTRRQLMSRGAALGAVLSATPVRDLLPSRAAYAAQPEVFGYGPLVSDPAGLLDLPEGFRYRTFSLTGETMSDGRRVAGGHDGMGSFAGPGDSTVLVRNHELSPGANGLTHPLAYDPLCPGGTTNLVVGPDGTLLSSYVSLAGTHRNCSGGITPWNTWLTGEETEAHPSQTAARVGRPHGYVFEVDPYTAPETPPVPLPAMGRFAHEAVAVDPSTGTVYETEDAGGPAGCFYRFRPWQPLGGPGSLAAGGVLEVMRVADAPADLSFVSVLGTTFADIHWDAIPVPDFDPTSTDATARLPVRRQTANPTRIPKCEGAYWGDGAVYFVSSFARPRHEGQVWRYEPAANTLTLVVQIAPGGTFDGPDNVIGSPYGGLFLCEDGDGESYVVGADDSGALYPFARNALNDSEFAGACFDKTGRTMFVNVQSPGITYAITGPWTSRSRHRRA